MYTRALQVNYSAPSSFVGDEGHFFRHAAARIHCTHIHINLPNHKHANIQQLFQLQIIVRKLFKHCFQTTAFEQSLVIDKKKTAWYENENFIIFVNDALKSSNGDFTEFYITKNIGEQTSSRTAALLPSGFQ